MTQEKEFGHIEETIIYPRKAAGDGISHTYL